jgi:hypothetical protein
MMGDILGPEVNVVGRVLVKGEDTKAHEAFKEKWDKNVLYRDFLRAHVQPERVIIELKLS